MFQQKGNDEGILEYERTKGKAKPWVNTIDFPLPFEFPKSCLIVEADILTLTDVVLYVRKI